jgi:hypothetical protein
MRVVFGTAAVCFAAFASRVLIGCGVDASSDPNESGGRVGDATPDASFVAADGPAAHSDGPDGSMDADASWSPVCNVDFFTAHANALFGFTVVPGGSLTVIQADSMTAAQFEACMPNDDFASQVFSSQEPVCYVEATGSFSLVAVPGDEPEIFDHAFAVFKEDTWSADWVPTQNGACLGPCLTACVPKDASQGP